MGVSMGGTFNYAPHAAQMEIHRARGKRFRMVCSGRRFGKTLCLAAEILERGGWERAGEYGWVAPTYNVAERGIEAFRMIGDGIVKVGGQSPRKIEFTGSVGPVRVWFLTADNPDSMRGYGFQGLVIDEAAMIAADVWHYVLRPTIAQTLGWAVLVSTPKGRNWFYDLFTRGLDPAETDYRSFTFPSNASPFFPAREWEEARRIMNENAFRQEYLAEFMEDSAGVFRGIDACLLNAECGVRNAECPRNVVIGCDVAKHTDFTVLIAMDADTGRCFAMERFNHLDWTIQKERIVAFSRKWRGRLILDATGVGDPIYDDLRRVLPQIEAVRFTTQTKEHLIQELAHAVEERKVCWPAASSRLDGLTVGRLDGGEGCRSDSWAGGPSDWGILTAEMKRFEYDLRPGGGINREIGQNLIDLGRVHPDRAGVRTGSPDDFDILADQPPQHVEHAGDRVVQVQSDRRDRLFAGKGQKLACNVSRTLRTPGDLLEVFTDGVVRADCFLGQLRVRHDAHQKVVEIVGHTTCEPTDGLHLLRLIQLRLQTPLLGHVVAN